MDKLRGSYSHHECQNELLGIMSDKVLYETIIAQIQKGNSSICHYITFF